MPLDGLKGLNPQQKEAVCHTGTPLLILAGAGSGKTRVITCRIAYLIHKLGVNPGNILGVTFTNKAANEMKQRVAKIVGKKAEGVTLSTFHSLGVKILRQEIHHLGYRRDFTIYAEPDQSSLVKSMLREHPKRKDKFDAGIVITRISQYKNRLIDGHDNFPLYNDKYDEILPGLYKQYQESLRTCQAVDFDDLILLTATLFQDHKKVLQKYQNKYQHILVDEYQDTNNGQYRLLAALAKAHKNLCVVGDDDQSIYSWRGAQVQNILNFTKDYPNAKVVKLEQNYRSTETILNAANFLIKNNYKRQDKTLWSKRGKGRNIDAFIARDENDEAKTIAWRLETIREQTKAEWNRFAVLYRSNTQSRALESVFRLNKIPYNVVGGYEFFDRKEIKDLVAYLKVILNPSSDLNLLRILNVPRRGIGNTTIQTITKDAQKKNISIFRELKQMQNSSAISKSGLAGIRSFVRLIDDLHGSIKTMDVKALVQRTIETTGYREELERTHDEPLAAQTKIEIVEEFVSAASAYQEQEKKPTLMGFIDSVSLGDEPGKGGKTKRHLDNAVTLSTLHSSKGLEFPYVFICGMEEDLFPHARSVGDGSQIDEERRLCYVGITRAQDHLTLSLTKERNKFGRKALRIPSRFLKELPENLLCKQFSHSPHFFNRQRKNGKDGE